MIKRYKKVPKFTMAPKVHNETNEKALIFHKKHGRHIPEYLAEVCIINPYDGP
jgi:hypothetical protein